MRKFIGVAIILIFLGLGVAHYYVDENFKELLNAIIAVIGIVQAINIFFDKSNSQIEAIDEKTSMILKILENDEE